MEMQSHNPASANPLALAPLCSICDQPMRITSAEFSQWKRQITFACASCGTQAEESSLDLQG